jgi:hypothetical protein
MRRFMFVFAAACGLAASARAGGAEDEATAVQALHDKGAGVKGDEDQRPLQVLAAGAARAAAGDVLPAVGVDFHGDKATDEAFGRVASLPRLRRLDIGESQVTDAGLDALKNSFKLQKLYLTETSVGDAGLARLKDLDRLEVLDLARTKITNAGLKRLAPLEALRVLDLSDTAVDAAGVAELKKLADAKKLGNLQELYLLGCKPKAAKALAVGLPGYYTSPLWPADERPFEDKVLDLEKALPQLKVVR